MEGSNRRTQRALWRALRHGLSSIPESTGNGLAGTIPTGTFHSPELSPEAAGSNEEHEKLKSPVSNSGVRLLRRNRRSPGSDFTGGFFFKSGNFSQTSQVAFSLAEVSCQKSFDKIPGQHGPHDPATETNNVHVIVLDPLPSREVIID